MSDIILGWQEVLAETERLVKEAEAGEWSRWENALANRDAQIRALSVLNVQADEVDQVRELIQRVQQGNKRLEALADALKDEALHALKEVDKGNKMKKAYGRAKRPD